MDDNLPAGKRKQLCFKQWYKEQNISNLDKLEIERIREKLHCLPVVTLKEFYQEKRCKRSNMPKEDYVDALLTRIKVLNRINRIKTVQTPNRCDGSMGKYNQHEEWVKDQQEEWVKDQHEERVKDQQEEWVKENEMVPKVKETKMLHDTPVKNILSFDEFIEVIKQYVSFKEEDMRDVIIEEYNTVKFIDGKVEKEGNVWRMVGECRFTLGDDACRLLGLIKKPLYDSIPITIENFDLLFPSRQLLEACKKGNVDEVRRLIKEPYVDINAEDECGWTPLIIASHHRFTEIINLLKFMTHVNIKYRTSMGWTALDHACAQNAYEIVRSLCNMLDISKNDMISAMVKALDNKNYDIVSFLLSRVLHMPSKDFLRYLRDQLKTIKDKNIRSLLLAYILKDTDKVHCLFLCKVDLINILSNGESTTTSKFNRKSFKIKVGGNKNRDKRDEENNDEEENNKKDDEYEEEEEESDDEDDEDEDEDEENEEDVCPCKSDTWITEEVDNNKSLKDWYTTFANNEDKRNIKCKDVRLGGCKRTIIYEEFIQKPSREKSIEDQLRLSLQMSKQVNQLNEKFSIVKNQQKRNKDDFNAIINSEECTNLFLQMIDDIHKEIFSIKEPNALFQDKNGATGRKSLFIIKEKTYSEFATLIDKRKFCLDKLRKEKNPHKEYKNYLPIYEFYNENKRMIDALNIDLTSRESWTFSDLISLKTIKPLIDSLHSSGFDDVSHSYIAINDSINEGNWQEHQWCKPLVNLTKRHAKLLKIWFEKIPEAYHEEWQSQQSLAETLDLLDEYDGIEILFSEGYEQIRQTLQNLKNSEDPNFIRIKPGHHKYIKEVLNPKNFVKGMCKKHPFVGLSGKSGSGKTNTIEYILRSTFNNSSIQPKDRKNDAYEVDDYCYIGPRSATEKAKQYMDLTLVKETRNLKDLSAAIKGFTERKENMMKASPENCGNSIIVIDDGQASNPFSDNSKSKEQIYDLVLNSRNNKVTRLFSVQSPEMHNSLKEQINYWILTWPPFPTFRTSFFKNLDFDFISEDIFWVIIKEYAQGSKGSAVVIDVDNKSIHRLLVPKGITTEKNRVLDFSEQLRNNFFKYPNIIDSFNKTIDICCIVCQNIETYHKGDDQNKDKIFLCPHGCSAAICRTNTELKCYEQTKELFNKCCLCKKNVDFSDTEDQSRLFQALYEREKQKEDERKEEEEQKNSERVRRIVNDLMNRNKRASEEDLQENNRDLISSSRKKPCLENDASSSDGGSTSNDDSSSEAEVAN